MHLIEKKKDNFLDKYKCIKILICNKSKLGIDGKEGQINEEGIKKI